MHPSAESSYPEWYGRSDHRFFHDQATKRAIVDIARAGALVIYCGAGVTMNRTGLSWYELVTELLRQEAIEESRAHDLPKEYEAAVERQLGVLRSALAPQHMASILSQSRLENAQSEQTEQNQLVHKLHALLYQDNRWQSGVIVRNIIRLAFGCLKLGRRVVIVTTNYDDYLEQEFAAYQGQMRKHTRLNKLPPPPIRGLIVRVLGDRGISVVRNSRGDGQLEIVYLHGRVPESGAHNSGVVLSEWDYHRTHGAAAEELGNLFRLPGAAALVLGSSMTDGPLLTALAATKGKPSRYALLPAQDAGIVRAASAEDFRKLKTYIGRRGMHFGVTLLIPDFRYQIAQFCEEVLTCVGLAPAPERYLQDRTHMRYGLRLVAWWDRWRRTEFFGQPEAIHVLLAQTLVGVRETLARHRGNAHSPDDREGMKVELWIRDSPEEHRRLALWGSSVGTLVDRSTVRAEELRLASGNASLRAFVEGQPQYVLKKTLAEERPPGQALRSTRWEAFLSVPILIDYGNDEQPVGLPVGVVTLATMRKPHESIIQHRSSRQMDELVRLLRSVGETLLRA